MLAGPKEAAASMPPLTCRSPSLEKRFQRFAARGRGVAEKGEGASQERLRALPPRPGGSAALLRPAPFLASRPAARLRAARARWRPAQPTRRPSARRARADRGSSSTRSEDVARGTRHAGREARGARDEGPLRRRARYVRGGRVVTARCRTLDAWRACLPDGRARRLGHGWGVSEVKP